MGLLRWLRGGDEDNASTGSMSAGMAELGGFFSPGQRKQTEHIQEQKRKRHDVHASDGGAIDLESGRVVIRKPLTD